MENTYIFFILSSDAFEGGEFFRGHVKVVDGEEALVFLSPKLLPKLSEATEIQADATFRTLPGLFKQLFTLHITKFNLVCFIEKIIEKKKNTNGFKLYTRFSHSPMF